jgi:hypothetical protein
MIINTTVQNNNNLNSQVFAAGGLNHGFNLGLNRPAQNGFCLLFAGQTRTQNVSS